MVLRIDLGYETGSGSVEQLQAHRDLFFQNRRSNGLLDYMVGYIWVMGYGQDRGPHLHLILFFNGQKVMSDGYYAMEICSYWKRIAGPNSWSHTSNLDKRKLKAEGKCGIGIVEHSDESMIRNLFETFDYLFKMEQGLPYRLSKNFRTMGRGEWPQTNERVGGRPRIKETTWD